MPCLILLLLEDSLKNRTILLILAATIALLGISSASVAAPVAGGYVVKQGDTLYSIARSLGVQLQALRDSNAIEDPSKIRAGQLLTVPESGQAIAEAAQPSPAPAGGSYVVKKGDTLYSVARSLGVKLQELQGANGISDPSNIRAGQLLVVPGAPQAAQAAGPAPTAPPAAAPAPAAAPPVAPGGAHRAASPDYGMNVFIMGAPSTTSRDLQKVKEAGFGWQKTLFQWRQIEGAGKGQFTWDESDRVVAASNDAGVKIIARLDFQPSWARADGAHNGPPTTSPTSATSCTPSSAVTRRAAPMVVCRPSRSGTSRTSPASGGTRRPTLASTSLC